MYVQNRKIKKPNQVLGAIKSKSLLKIPQNTSKYFCWRLLITISCYMCLFDGVKRHFQQYFSYIVAVSFIGGWNRGPGKTPPTCRKSLINFIAKCCTPRPDRDSHSQHQWWKSPMSCYKTIRSPLTTDRTR
jgi:hypothetical protein